jgi:hypothetical protein
MNNETNCQFEEAGLLQTHNYIIIAQLSTITTFARQHVVIHQYKKIQPLQPLLVSTEEAFAS